MKIPGKIRRLLGLHLSRKIQGSGNTLSLDGYYDDIRIDIRGNDNTLIFEKNVKVTHALFRIHGNNCRIVIGRNVRIGSGEFWVEDNACILSIGENSTIESGHFAVTEDGSELRIGSDCMLAKEIEIRTGDSHSLLNSEGERINPAGHVIVDEHVWIASRAMVLKNVHIQKGAVIAAGAIVTADVAAHSIVAGNPARQVKQDIRWTRQRIKAGHS